MSDAQLVVVGTFLNQIEANLAQGALEAGGVQAMVSADDAGGLRSHLSLLFNLRLLVRADDAQHARRILGQSQ